MALKRKRSDPSLSSSPAHSTSANSSPAATTTVPSYFPPTKLSPPHQDIWTKQYQLPSAVFLPPPPQHHHPGGRTMKRHRDSRPDESQVHASTVARLFHAQRTAHISPPVSPWVEHAPSAALLPDEEPDWQHGVGNMEVEEGGAEIQGSGGQGSTTTLHRFWAGLIDAAPRQHGEMDVVMDSGAGDVDMATDDDGAGPGRGTGDLRGEQRTTLHRFWGR